MTNNRAGIVPLVKQRGFALLLLLLVLVIAGSSFVLGGFNNQQSAYQQQQTELHRQMQQAKTRLLAYVAASNALSGNTNGPGFFPCPDTDNDGQAETTCDPVDTTLADCYADTSSKPAPLIGRLPQTVVQGSNSFVLSDYNAGVDQQFWYVVAPRYVVHSTPVGTTLNSLNRTSATGSLYDNMRMCLDTTKGYVVFIIAPGEALDTQDRTANQNLYSNYLDGQNGSDNFSFFSTYASNPTAFNDQIIGITLAEYMLATGVRPAVEIKKKLDTYYTAHFSRYPHYASTFSTLMNDSSEYSWLRPAVTSGNNGERWSDNLSYVRNSNSSSTISYSGCNNISYTIDHNSGTITRQGTTC